MMAKSGADDDGEDVEMEWIREKLSIINSLNTLNMSYVQWV